VRRKQLGPGHRDTLLTSYLLACLLEEQPGRQADAFKLFEEVYEARIRSLGQEHVETRQAYLKLRACEARL